MSPADATLQWVQEFVIGHALCPFAAQPFAQGRVTAVPLHPTTFEEAIHLALTQVQELVGEKAERVETSLLIYPEYLLDFEDFLDTVYTLEELLEQSGANELVQLAHFHPDYRFADLEPDDAANLTNRSPYPVIQLLRVGSVAAAVAAYPNIDDIPERNIAKMRELFG